MKKYRPHKSLSRNITIMTTPVAVSPFLFIRDGSLGRNVSLWLMLEVEALPA